MSKQQWILCPVCGNKTRTMIQEDTEMRNFPIYCYFHMLRHAYTSNLLSKEAAPKDVQELLGHADVSTTMNIYAHATVPWSRCVPSLTAGIGARSR